MINYYEDSFSSGYTNIKESEGNLIGGKKEGEWLYYYVTGEICREEFYIDGKKDGKWIWYNSGNGVIWKKINYKDGLEDGRWTQWYSNNGQKHIDGNYKGGKEDGKWTYYNENGSLQKVEEYKDGELTKTDHSEWVDTDTKETDDDPEPIDFSDFDADSPTGRKM